MHQNWFKVRTSTANPSGLDFAAALVVTGTSSCFTHALCHMNRFAKFYECFGSIMQIYDCTVVVYFMVFQKQIGKIGTPFLTVLSLCGHNDPLSGVFGIFMLFIKTIKLEKHCLPNLIICLLSTQVENSILAGRITGNSCG